MVTDSIVSRGSKEDCRHEWMLLLLTAVNPRVAVLHCERCDAYDDELWTGGLTPHLYLDLGNGITINQGVHNSRFSAKIPVTLYVRQSLGYNLQQGTTVPEVEVRVVPQGTWDPGTLSPEHDVVLEGAVVTVTTEDLDLQT